MSPPWMPLYIGDYLADTAHLRPAEHGAYLLLIMHYWRTGGLPTEDASLSRIARMTAAEWRKAKEPVERLFQPGWKHKRIEFELTEAARISEAGRCGGKASGKARRKKSLEKSNAELNDRSTTVERFANDPPTKREALPSPSPSTEEPKGGSSAAIAAPKPPLYTDSRHELWGEGVPILQQLGLSERDARSNIGRWLRDQKDDSQGVLGAIQRARDARVVDAIPWITRALGDGHGSNRQAGGEGGGKRGFSGIAIQRARAAGLNG